MDEVHVIKHKVLVEGRSIRAVAREMGVARNTVKRYLAEATQAGVRKATRKARPVSDAVRPRLHAVLGEGPRWTGGKQRLTARKVHEILVAEGYAISARAVRWEVAEWKRQRQEVFIPLVYRMGELAEVDFFEVLVEVRGTRRKAWMFLMRLMYSGRDFAWLYPRQDQVCFLDGHVRAFRHFGAAPHRLIYDNLKPAVARVLVGAERALAARFEALASHYVIEASFARPRTGHDKGGVEARGKGIRWQHLVPIPTGTDLTAISDALLARLDASLGRPRSAEEPRSVSDLFAEEFAAMLPLPSTHFRPAEPSVVAVSRRGLVKVGSASYSVWCEWAGLEVTVHLGVDQVDLVGRDGRTVTHPRVASGQRSIDYRHYLPELARKPQAVRQVSSELVRDLGPPFRELWEALVEQDGPIYASRIFAKVIEAIVDEGRQSIVERIVAAREQSIPILLALKPPPAVPPMAPAHTLPSALQEIEVHGSGVKHFDELLLGDVA